MTTNEKLAAILAAVQTDPGNRGLARDPHDNLFTACPGDFVAACRSIAEHKKACPAIVTGFYIPSAEPPANETDGPLGSLFLARALAALDCPSLLVTDHVLGDVFGATLSRLEHVAGITPLNIPPRNFPWHTWLAVDWKQTRERWPLSHLISIECIGPSWRDARCRSMRGFDITDHTPPAHFLFDANIGPRDHLPTIGMGDGGNEIGMGRVPWDLIARNITNGDQIACRVPTDHLIVAGVSNWGAYALAAGIYVLRGVKPAPDLFDPDREREILEVMVREGPLVDGVTGKQTATVDGLTWEEYVKPLIRIRKILES
ncbi:glutamate cyclase domain-containing protein [Frigoriglobus tundricola]|uniref:D-glutamate cyclase-like C-terminal domain-containing protein n=1 Tax=Frigoriglobus tundricola TaxID=2774151 RepID=A0A6M5YZJ3_9BACT|nr:glutamate cyclase domain-containing protein [Frigoriglobus tundricola]QJW99375.1 hypothetical protein FTUN_6987 [Frigoriglobus tundricola]